MSNSDREMPERSGGGDFKLATVRNRRSSLRIEIGDISNDGNCNNFRKDSKQYVQAKSLHFTWNIAGLSNT